MYQQHQEMMDEVAGMSEALGSSKGAGGHRSDMMDRINNNNSNRTGGEEDGQGQGDEDEEDDEEGAED